MSCSSVNIQGVGNATTQTPGGPPLLVANLNPIDKECATKENTAVIYPSKFTKDSVVEVTSTTSDQIVGLQNLSAANPAGCGSDNSTLLLLLQ